MSEMGSPERTLEYYQAAFQDMMRYRNALWEIEQLLWNTPALQPKEINEALVVAGKALRNYEPYEPKVWK